MGSWKADLLSAARASKARCDTLEAVGDEAHGRCVVALLHCLAVENLATILVEPRTPDRSFGENARPADIFVLHPNLGCFLVEVKAWSLDTIVDIEAGAIFHRALGANQADNPWRQAQEASAQVQKAVRRTLVRRGLDAKECPFFDKIVAMPNIGRQEWKDRGFDQCIAGGEILLREDLADAPALWTFLKSVVKAKARHRLPCTGSQLQHVLEALGSSSVRRSRDQANAQDEPGTLGRLFDLSERRDERLSPEQRVLAEARFDGRPQLVRGVAGSGKSRVLVENLARRILRREASAQKALPGVNPAPRFAVVCFNQTLAPFLRETLRSAYARLAYRELPDYVEVHHINDFQYHLALRGGGSLEYQRWNSEPPAPDKAARFAARYSDQLDRLQQKDPAAYQGLLYDAIYVDEGQDFFEEEYLFLLRLLRTDPETDDKNLVIFYDDAQNIYGRPRPTWSKLGLQLTGRRSYVMKTCFRNSKPIIEHAFNLLLGVRAETRVSTKGFADTAYLKENALVTELPDRWEIHFADRLEGDAPAVYLFPDRAAEKQWVVQRITELIRDQEVRPEDILVLAEGPAGFDDLTARLTRACPTLTRFNKPFGAPTNPAKKRHILQPEHLTMTTVGSAKGYDCPVVFVMGADLFPNDVTGRATLYVASTRSKMQLYITGLNTPGSLAQEAKQVADLLATPVVSQGALAAAAPQAATEAAAAAQEPTNLVTSALLRGDKAVHPVYGEGTVLCDGTPRLLASRNLLCQQVDVQFAATRKDGLVAEIAGLVRLPAVGSGKQQ